MRRVLATLVALTFALALPAMAQNRHALVVGIDTYESLVDLQKARNDARAVADALERAGFAVQTALDPGRRALNRAISDFVGALEPGDEAVFYYAGHGIEVEGRNYLIPADLPPVTPGDEAFLIGETVAVDRVLDSMRGRGVRVSMLILDACRDNPFPSEGRRSIGGRQGLAETPAPEGAFILYSASGGQAAFDNLGPDDTNPNSVFTRALLPLIEEPGLPVHEVARRLRREVMALAQTVQGNQRPAYYDEITGEFALTPPPETPVATPEERTEIVLDDPCVAAASVWPAIADSRSIAGFEGFLARYRRCATFAALANERIAALSVQPSDPPATPGRSADPTDPPVPDGGEPIQPPGACRSRSRDGPRSDAKLCRLYRRDGAGWHARD